jgi:hypothetical protein
MRSVAWTHEIRDDVLALLAEETAELASVIA